MRKFIFFAVIFSMLGCKVYKTPAESDSYVKIGEGGGFTGAWVYYYFLPNGQVFEEKTEGKWIEMKKISGSSVRRIQSKINVFFNESANQLNKPGNMSRLILRRQKGTEIQTLWPAEGTDPVKDSMYNYLTQFIIPK